MDHGKSTRLKLKKQKTLNKTVTSGKWQVTSGKWQVASDKWQVTSGK